MSLLKSNMTNFDLAGVDAGAAFGPNFFSGKIKNNKSLKKRVNSAFLLYMQEWRGRIWAWPDGTAGRTSRDTTRDRDKVEIETETETDRQRERESKKESKRERARDRE